MLYEYAVVQSFSNSGRPHDNVVAESFFVSFKKEELYRRDHTFEPQFKRGINSNIEFYNRPLAKLGEAVKVADTSD